ncbi:MAG: TAXI family TRAP transporter solute-binding subunit [Moorellaceae bacterium]
MRIRLSRLLALILMLSSLMLAACGGTRQPAVPEGSSGGGSPSATTPVEITIGTGPSGGAFYPLGVKLSESIPQVLPNYRVTAQPTGAGAENIKRVSSGELDLGITYASNIYWANRGEKIFTQAIPVRILVAGQLAPYVLVVRQDSGVRSWTDLKGKRIVDAPQGGLLGTELFAAALQCYGLSSKDLKSVSKAANLQDAVEQIKNGQLDGVFWPVPRGTTPSALIDLARSTGVSWVGFDEGTVAKLLEIFPFLRRVEVPAGSNEGQSAPYVTVSDTTVIFVHESMDQTVAYDLTKAIVENNRFTEIGPAGAEWTLEAAVACKGSVDYHPGAVKYYKEKGVWD